MKRFILAISLVALGIGAFTPVALAKQASTPRELSENATLHDLVLHNRDQRSQK